MKTDTEYFQEALANFRALPSSRGLASVPYHELPRQTMSAILTEAQLLKDADTAAEQTMDGTRYLPVGENG